MPITTIVVPHRRTRCDNCAYQETCHKDARDPDCWPYGLGCDEFTTERMFLEYGPTVDEVAIQDRGLIWWQEEEHYAKK